MVIDSKDANAQHAAKEAADNARALAEKQQNQLHWQQLQEADAKRSLENSPQVQAANAAARADQERSSMGIVNATLGIAAVCTGVALAAKLEGCTKLTTLSGDPNSNVATTLGPLGNFNPANPAASSAATGPAQTQSPLYAFLGMQKNP